MGNPSSEKMYSSIVAIMSICCVVKVKKYHVFGGAYWVEKITIEDESLHISCWNKYIKNHHTESQNF